MSAEKKLSKTQLIKISQSGECSDAFLSKIAGPFIKVAVPLAKNLLAPLEVMAASTIDEKIQRKLYDSGLTLVISNEDMDDEDC